SASSHFSSSSRPGASNSTSIFPSCMLTTTRRAETAPSECNRFESSSAPWRVRQAKLGCAMEPGIAAPKLDSHGSYGLRALDLRSDFMSQLKFHPLKGRATNLWIRAPKAIEYNASAENATRIGCPARSLWEWR